MSSITLTVTDVARNTFTLCLPKDGSLADLITVLFGIFNKNLSQEVLAHQLLDFEARGGYANLVMAVPFSIVFAGRHMSNANRALSDVGIHTGITLFYRFRLRGCACSQCQREMRVSEQQAIQRIRLQEEEARRQAGIMHPVWYR